MWPAEQSSETRAAQQSNQRPGRAATIPTMTTGYGGRQLTAMRRLVADTYGLDRCYLCGEPIETFAHMDIEHIITRAARPDLAWDITNMRPAHGYRSPARYRCNQRRGTSELDAYRRRQAVDRRSLFKDSTSQAAPRPLPVSPDPPEKSLDSDNAGESSRMLVIGLES